MCTYVGARVTTPTPGKAVTTPRTPACIWARPASTGQGPHVPIASTDLTVTCTAGAFAKQEPKAYGQGCHPQIPTN